MHTHLQMFPQVIMSVKIVYSRHVIYCFYASDIRKTTYPLLSLKLLILQTHLSVCMCVLNRIFVFKKYAVLLVYDSCINVTILLPFIICYLHSTVLAVLDISDSHSATFPPTNTFCTLILSYNLHSPFPKDT